MGSADSASASNRLLSPSDPSPFRVTNSGAVARLLFVGDHAGRAIPGRLVNLGLTGADLDRHIAWDIGVEGLGSGLATTLGACFVRQTYSRLVIDCNRRPGAPDSIPPTSDGSPIPGNADLTASQKRARFREIYQPYHRQIRKELSARKRAGPGAVLVALHSFTPVFQGAPRPWRFGVLHRGDSPFSNRMLAAMKRSLGAAVGDNQPYAMDASDNTVPLHAGPGDIDYLEIEVRQDLIADEAGQAAVRDLLAAFLDEARAGG
ncbi:MAG TPA: N-formylglutamate amidohydrolase [Caulobacteraceae bacterium]